MLRMVQCFLRPSKLEGLRDLLLEKGVDGMSVTDARGFGARSANKPGKPAFEERVRVEIVVHEEKVEEILKALKQLAGAGGIGAGMAFVLPVEDALRLSTRDRGASAIS